MSDLLAIMRAKPGQVWPDGVRAELAEGWCCLFRAEPAATGWLAALSASQRARAAQAGLERQRTWEALSALGDLLPVAPGLDLDPARVPVLIRANRALLEQSLSRFAGLVEYQVTVLWDEEQVLARFRDSAEIAPLFVAERLEAADLVQAQTRLAERLRAEIAALLEPLCPEMAEQPRAALVLFNRSLLIPRNRVMELDLALERIDSIWPEGFRVRLVGPSPAVTFVLLDVTDVGVREIARARDVLGLPRDLSEAGIAEARRALARQPGADIAALNHAASILSLQAAAGAAGPLPHLSVRGPRAVPEAAAYGRVA